MQINTFVYCIKQGLKNISRNKLFSLASVATISACIFLFCLFYSIVENFQYMVDTAQTTVGITAFFDENYSDEEIKLLGSQIRMREEVLEMNYISAETAWESFKEEYFGDMDKLAEGFADDNPLAGSASYEIFLKDISTQDAFVSYLQEIPGVRKVNYSSVAVAGLSNFNRMIGYLSAIIIGVLLAVSIFLISNTITIAISVRKDEIKIMKLIGAANFMVRAPFVVEGILIGLFGTIIPLGAIYYIYENAVRLILEKFHILSNVIVFLPFQVISQTIIPASLLLGIGIGFFGSIMATYKHLKV